MTSIEPVTRYEGISGQGFAHPADRAAMAALRSIPPLSTAIKKFTELSYERRLRQLFLGQAVRLGQEQLPRVWALQRECVHTLDIDPCPQLYVTQAPVGQAMTIGANQPVILVMSGLVGSYSEDELRSVLAHETGHVLADHVAFTTAFVTVTRILRGVFRGQPLVGIPLLALYHALLEWSRAAELTADRAAALVVADPRIPCRTLMRVAGGPIEGLDLDAFIRQATDYQDEGDPFARWSRFFSEIQTTHPFPVRRVRELISWVASGEYDRIRSGQYLRRGQEPPPSQEFEKAFEHYRTRFAGIVERAGTGIQNIADRIGSWLDGNRRGGEDGFDAGS
jgi:Zn-dependent protease with chaperone function